MTNKIIISDLKQSVQDNSVFLYKNYIFSLCGFCCGLNVSMCPSQLRSEVSKNTSYKRGFIKEIYRYDIISKKWIYLKNLDIQPRQGQRTFFIKNKIYIIGGYSYTPLTTYELNKYKILPSKQGIFTYNNGCIYDFSTNNLINEKEIKLPFNICNFGCIYVNNRLYLINGCIYDKKSFNNNYIVNKEKIGKLFIKFKIDNNNFINDSSDLSPFPGSGRFNQIYFLKDKYIYILNGCSTSNILNKSKGYNEYTYCNIIDNWKYDIINNRWTRLKDYPIPMGNQGYVIYDNKYLILIGGCSYNKTITYPYAVIDTKNIIKSNDMFPYNNISSIKNNFIKSNKDTCSGQYNKYFSNMVMIYDIENDSYKISNYKLPFNISGANLILKDDIIYILAGELNPTLINNTYYGNHLGGLVEINIDKIFI